MSIAMFTDMTVICIAYAMISGNMTLFAFALQIMAGDVTAKSERVFKQLTALAVTERNLDWNQRISSPEADGGVRVKQATAGHVHMCR